MGLMSCSCCLAPIATVNERRYRLLPTESLCIRCTFPAWARLGAATAQATRTA